jgi:hypothetical protein
MFQTVSEPPLDYTALHPKWQHSSIYTPQEGGGRFSQSRVYRLKPAFEHLAADEFKKYEYACDNITLCYDDHLPNKRSVCVVLSCASSNMMTE